MNVFVIRVILITRFKLASQCPSWGIYKHAPTAFWRKRLLLYIYILKKGGQIRRFSWQGELVRESRKTPREGLPPLKSVTPRAKNYSNSNPLIQNHQFLEYFFCFIPFSLCALLSFFASRPAARSILSCSGAWGEASGRLALRDLALPPGTSSSAAAAANALVSSGSLRLSTALAGRYCRNVWPQHVK